MGFPIPPTPPTIEHANDCAGCFPAGKTPKFLYAIFLGIKDCWPGDPNGSPPGQMILQQSIFDPCFWSVGAGWEWGAAYDAKNNGGSLLGLNFGPISYFTGFIAAQCELHFSNLNNCGYGLWHGEMGTGMVIP